VQAAAWLNEESSWGSRVYAWLQGEAVSLRPAIRWLGRSRARLGRFLGPRAVATARIVKRASSWLWARVEAGGKATTGKGATRRLGLNLTATRLGLSAQMAAHGVLAKPLRSALTILGVAIGVASVVSLMGVGEGARRAVLAQFESLGTNVVVVRAEDPSVVFRPEEAEELEAIRAYDTAKAAGDEAIPFEQAVTEIERTRDVYR